MCSQMYGNKCIPQLPEGFLQYHVTLLTVVWYILLYGVTTVQEFFHFLFFSQKLVDSYQQCSRTALEFQYFKAFVSIRK